MINVVSIGIFGRIYYQILELMDKFVKSIANNNRDLKFSNQFKAKMPPTRCDTPKHTCVFYNFLQKTSNISFSFKIVNPFDSFYHLHNFANAHYNDKEFMLFSDGLDLADTYYQLEYIEIKLSQTKYLKIE